MTEKDKEFLNLSISITSKGESWLKLLKYCEKEYHTIWKDYYWKIKALGSLESEKMYKIAGRTTTIKEEQDIYLNYVHNLLESKTKNIIKFKLICYYEKFMAHLLDIKGLWRSGYKGYKKKNNGKEVNSYLKIFRYVIKKKIISYWFKKFNLKLNFIPDDTVKEYLKLLPTELKNILPKTYTIKEGILYIFKSFIKLEDN